MTLRFHAGGPPEQRALAAWTIAAGDQRLFVPALGKQVLHERQNQRCYLCAEPRRMILHVPRGGVHMPERATRDHVFPQRAGGGAFMNILLAHGDCNVRKGGRWPYPCEVIFLASIYAVPSNASARARRRAARWAQRK